MACKDIAKKNKRNNAFMKKWYAELNPEDKKILRDKNNLLKRKWKQNMTPEQREVYLEKERNRYKNDPVARRKHADRALFNRIGLSLKQKEELLQSQDGKCASCGAEEPGTKIGWHADHDHNTKFIRGILCGPCNTLLGFLEKQSDRIELLKKYLNFKPDYNFEVL